MATQTNPLASVPDRNGPPAGPDTLAGGAPESKQVDPSELNRNFMNLVRSIHEDLDNLARQYPEMSKAAKRAKDALTDGMVSRMSQQGNGSQQGSPAALAA